VTFQQTIFSYDRGQGIDAGPMKEVAVFIVHRRSPGLRHSGMGNCFVASRESS
jgi:hypothetical protein